MSRPSAARVLALLSPNQRAALEQEFVRREEAAAATARELDRIAAEPVPVGDSLPERLSRLASWCARHGVLIPSYRRVEVWSHEDRSRLSLGLEDADFARLTVGHEVRRTYFDGREFCEDSSTVDGVHVTRIVKIEPAPVEVEIVQHAAQEPA